MAYVVPRAESMQYDGTNATEVAGWVGKAELVSVIDGVLTLSVTAATLTYDVVLHPGWWVLRQNGECGGAYPPDRYALLWLELAPAGVVTA